MKIIPDNPADVKMIKKENYLNIMDVLLAFSVKFPVTVFDYLHGYTTGMWNTLFLHLRHWTNTLNIYVSAYLCKEVLLLPRFNFTKPHSYWAHSTLSNREYSMSPKNVPQGGKTNSGCQIEEPKGKHALSVLSLWTDNIINELFMVQQLSC